MSAPAPTLPAVLPVLDWNTLDEAARVVALTRPAVTVGADVASTAARIIEDVRRDGDAALHRYSRELDGVSLEQFRVSSAEFVQAQHALTEADHRAIADAHANIQRFHAPQLRQPDSVETAPGVICERVYRPIQAVGLYVPAGSAPLPSTVLMLGVPAALAACPLQVLCAPPRANGTMDPAILVAAQLCGIDQVFKLGGAQAVAAMAYGTESVPATDKIFGPGNAWVTAAKRLVAQDPDGAASDMPAGPSEVLVIADDTARADFVAADMLSQAEHGPDSQVVLVTDSARIAEDVADELLAQVTELDRADIAGRALAHARLLVVSNIDQAVALSNRYAPEHLIVQTRAPRQLLPAITAAGSVFLGHYAPEAIGDYCSGTNHVLPTYGHARAYSGLSVDAFVRSMTVQAPTPLGLREIGPTAVTLAELEGLDAHARAVSIRLDAIDQALGAAAGDETDA